MALVTIGAPPPLLGTMSMQLCEQETMTMMMMMMMSLSCPFSLHRCYYSQLSEIGMLLRVFPVEGGSLPDDQHDQINSLLQVTQISVYRLNFPV